MRETPLPPSGTPLRKMGDAGFTLIEVVAALIFFSVGVLMVVRLTGSLALQMDTAALRSVVVVTAQERLEGMEQLPYDSVAVGTTADTVTLLGRSYQREAAVTQYHPRVREITVTLSPLAPGGPRYTVTSYVILGT